jgi:hypothetical protein
VYEALAAETGVPIDAAAAVTRLGPPLDEELVRWFPADAARQRRRPVPRALPGPGDHADPGAGRGG